MAERQWTDKQRQSIQARGGTLLVSAAAGSGKTAVLVERVIDRITDPENPIDITELLIVTFTRAAAAEMRERLSKALSEKIAAQPENTHYQRQQMLLPQANISTIHGFCARLLREQAGRAGLPVGFIVAEEGQARLLAAQAMEEVLEERYRRRDQAFLSLAFQLNSQKNDAGLREAMEKTYEFMQAQPFPAEWLQEQLDTYTAVCPLEDTVWVKAIRVRLDLALESAEEIARRGLALLTPLALDDSTYRYVETLQVDIQSLGHLRETLKTAPYDVMVARAKESCMTDMPRIRKNGDAVLEECRELMKKTRKLIQAQLKCLPELLQHDEATCRADLQTMAPMVEALGELVTAYEKRYVQLKREKKWLDYNDLEHESLRLLLDAQTKQPTALATELSKRFVEIMVDEYQDTNGAQDALFHAISREGNNLFMVGDVKQSIYGFRQARPQLFTDLRRRCATYDPAAPRFPAVITLEKNFRSREEVTEAVNFFFRQMMQERLGNIAYDESEALEYGATYYDPARGCETEWLLLDGAKGDGETRADIAAEAGAVARRIQRLMQEMTVRDKETCRPLAYGDICILFRSHGPKAAYGKELARCGIPVSNESGSGLLAAPEIQVVLSLLRVVDNPLRDVELAAVMLSPLYGFTPDDCARVRLNRGKGVHLYTALGQVAKGSSPLAARCEHLLADLARLRTLAVSLPADRLLERLYRDLAVEAVYATGLAGRQRVANLHQLDRVARQYERGGFRGLSSFVRYVDRLEENGKDLPVGSTDGGGGVRLMTVHGSKGLEFPVVILANLSGEFNKEDFKKPYLFHVEAGIGLRLRDEESLTKHIALPYLGVSAACKQDMLAEELRLWYVALTRAREKLILVHTAKDLDKLLEKLEGTLPAGRELLPGTLLQAASPGEWLLTAALRHPSFVSRRKYPELNASLAAEKPWLVTCVPPCARQEEEAGDTTESAAPDGALTDALRQRVRYRYPYAPLQAVPAKLAASQLSHEQLSREYIAHSRPTFLEQEGMTAAQRGTALHTFMQFADYARAAADLPGEVERLATAGFLTARQAAVLPSEKLQSFFAGDLYRRMAASPDCRREYHFAVTVEAGGLADLPAAMATEPVVVQGIADCVFREGDRLILVDYKTDRVKTPEELVERYRSQMAFYKQALELLLGYPVGQILLYSFHLEQTVEVI